MSGDTKRDHRKTDNTMQQISPHCTGPGGMGGSRYLTTIKRITRRNICVYLTILYGGRWVEVSYLTTTKRTTRCNRSHHTVRGKGYGWGHVT